MKPLVILQIVSWNSGEYISKCVDSLKSQILTNYRTKIVIIDNASTDETIRILESGAPLVHITKLQNNIGFTGAHNHGIRQAIAECADYICLINPDLTLEPNAIEMLIQATQIGPQIGASTPLLYRTENKVKSNTLDACGMELLDNLRHLDRGSNKVLSTELSSPSYVFGGTGACLLLTKEAIADISYPPGLTSKGQESQFFDPMFFAYREDAEAALRLQLRGWRIRYEPNAIGYHVRQVLPENRKQVTNTINGLSVRNRFLIQINCAPIGFLVLILPSWLIRNLVVIFACLLSERTSLPYLREIYTHRSDIRKKRNWNLSRKLVGCFTLSTIIEGSNRSKEVALVSQLSPKNDHSSVHAVIVAYHSNSELKLNVVSVLKALTKLPRSKLSIVNNAPDDLEFGEIKDLILKLAEDFTNVSLEILNNEINLGFGGASNKVLLNSNYDVYLVLNADIGLEDISLDKLLSQFSRYSNLAVLSPLIKDRTTQEIQYQYLARRFPRFRDLILDFLKPFSPTLKTKLETHRSYADYQALKELVSNEPLDKLVEVEQVSGACFLIKASTFNSIEGFNTAFHPAWYEDVDICKRISNLGLTSAISSASSVSHRGAESLDSISSRKFTTIFLGNKLRYYKIYELNCLKLAIAIPLIYLELILKLLYIGCKDNKKGTINDSNIYYYVKTFYKNQINKKS